MSGRRSHSGCWRAWLERGGVALVVVVGLAGALGLDRTRASTAGLWLGASARLGGGLEARGEHPRPPSAHAHAETGGRIAFVGDVSLGLGIGLRLAQRARGERLPTGIDADFPFGAVGPRLRQADLVVGNLECVVSLRSPTGTSHRPLGCPVGAVELLARAGFGLLGLANNHALDFGPLGVADTMRALEQRGLDYFGGEVLRHAPPRVHTRTVGAVRVGLLAFYDDPTERPLAELRRARAGVDVLGVYAHWGREDQSRPLADQRRLGRAFVDAGADVVIGTHAHVLQPCEWYRGKLIAYGLGNFAFAGMGDRDAHRRGAILELEAPHGRICGHRWLETRLDDDGAPHITTERDLGR